MDSQQVVFSVFTIENQVWRTPLDLPKVRNPKIDIFEMFSQLIPFSVSAVASSWFFAVGNADVWLKSCLERSGEAKTDLKKNILKNKLANK